ncbi:acyltransferase [Pseudorhodoplanes sinuspersici]|uniref:Acetyltransferase n=1 Tax=Pseudorhodoplanes sinuspersici TaxID=1235591 RepID=A0A1W6ZPV7_9HYPH|nr:DapH/DapD/GlmU-related protein [Pseudorhodoplanes sinuspersici]ARP99352.1 acetyltransferase [Pseudorhodoplanes sinuspersici]RKE70283.1 succinyltransferase-like protein [Pseudorhodoplanes sinuspersici]
MRSLNQFLKLQRFLVSLKRFFYVRFWGMDIHPTVVFSLSAKFDKTYPKGIHINEYTYVAFDVAILAHDMTRALKCDTVIGRNCFIGARSIILPGVKIGDGCVIGAGSVVTKDVPPHTAVAGNPARILRQNISVGQFGKFHAT